MKLFNSSKQDDSSSTINIINYLNQKSINELEKILNENINNEKQEYYRNIINFRDRFTENDLVLSILYVGNNPTKESFKLIMEFCHDIGAVDIILNDLLSENNLTKCLNNFETNGIYDTIKDSYDSNNGLFSKKLIEKDFINKISRSTNSGTVLMCLFKSIINKKVISELVKDTDKFRRRAAAFILRKHQNDLAISLLKNLLDDADEETRQFAASSLVCLKGESYLEALLSEQKEEASLLLEKINDVKGIFKDKFKTGVDSATQKASNFATNIGSGLSNIIKRK